MSTTQQEYDKFLEDTSWYKHTGEGNIPELAYLALGLAGESGEFADEVKKLVRVIGFDPDVKVDDDIARAKLLDELGDVMWYFRKLIIFLGSTEEQLMAENTYKLYTRLKTKVHFRDFEWPLSEFSYTEVFGGKHLTKEEPSEEKE